MEINSEHAVALRREWVAEKYLSGVPPQIIWREYGPKYKLTKHSFDKDITTVREELQLNVREDYEEILNNELNFLYDIRDKALKEGDKSTALRTQKQITDLVRLVAPKQSKTVNVQVNNNTQNVNLPTLSVTEIRDLLSGSSGMKTLELPTE